MLKFEAATPDSRFSVYLEIIDHLARHRPQNQMIPGRKDINFHLSCLFIGLIDRVFNCYPPVADILQSADFAKIGPENEVDLVLGRYRCESRRSAGFIPFLLHLAKAPMNEEETRTHSHSALNSLITPSSPSKALT
jgi:hypothetical protein